MVLVLVCPHTVEEVILEASERKRSLDAKVIQAGLFNEASTAADRARALQEVLHTDPPAASSAPPPLRDLLPVYVDSLVLRKPARLSGVR